MVNPDVRLREQKRKGPKRGRGVGGWLEAGRTFRPGPSRRLLVVKTVTLRKHGSRLVIDGIKITNHGGHECPRDCSYIGGPTPLPIPGPWETNHASKHYPGGVRGVKCVPPLYLPPTHMPADMPPEVAMSAFTHYPLEGRLPYQLRSRAQIMMYADITLVIPDDEWHAVPALGERVCQEVDNFQLIIALIDEITNEMGTFVPAKRAFHLPPSLFAEVPVLMAIYNTHTEMCENVLVHFQGTCAYLQHIFQFEEKGHIRDPLIAAGSLSKTHPRDEVYLPADSNRAIWTPFWECFSTGHTYRRILAIAQRNAHLFDEVAADDGNDPRNVPNSWRLWLSVYSDLSPPRWLTEHWLHAHIWFPLLYYNTPLLWCKLYAYDGHVVAC
ncbi:hypothetical protein LXA43DRAFT_1069214 [Ganoderma leucocontextum]|nr:hypothetical protein LXA43DRAFT_1069214 [Ganoderma leucocontextum]